MFKRIILLFVGVLIFGCAELSSNDSLPSFQQALANQPGHDAKVIAHWNVVPFQTITTDFSIGVVAFHINGIKRIDFQINGGEIRSVEEMTINTRTDTYEYMIPIYYKDIDTIGLKRNRIEVSAVIYPKGSGIPRKLEILPLNLKNSDFTQENIVWVSGKGNDDVGDGSKNNPYRQPKRALQKLFELDRKEEKLSYSTIYLKEGEYVWGSNGYRSPVEGNRWVTISAAPGSNRAKVIFNTRNKDNFLPKLLKISGVTIDNIFFYPGSGKSSKLWIENSNIIGPGPTVGRGFLYASNWSDIYFTNVDISNYPNGATSLSIARNVKVNNIGSDAFSGTKLVVNSEVNGIDKRETKFHPDVYQVYCNNKQLENYIVYGLIARNVKAQGIFSGGCKSLDNVAFVNVLIARPFASDPSKPFYSQWTVSSNHLVMSGLTLPNSALIFRTDDLKNVLVDGSVFYSLGISLGKKNTTTWPEGVIFRNLHLIRPPRTKLSSGHFGITYGEADFSDLSNNDFSPNPGSPLRNRIDLPFTKIDIYSSKRDSLGSIGAIN